MFYNIFRAFFCLKICIYQKFVVPLHSKSEKVLYYELLPVSVTGNVGVRPARNSRQKNTYRECAEEKRGAFPISGSSFFVTFAYETNIHIALGDHL